MLNTVISVFLTVLLFWGGVTSVFAGEKFSTKDLLKLEEEARVVAKNIKFLTPIIEFDPRYSKEINLKFKSKYSDSAFTVAYRGRIFLLTAAHIVNDWKPENKVFFYDGKNWIEAKSRFVVSNMLDLAAIDITNLFNLRNFASNLKNSTDDLMKYKSGIFAVCNPLQFSDPFAGFFETVEKYGDSKLRQDRLVMASPGTGVEGGCSGSPIVDKNGLVLGLVVTKNVYTSDGLQKTQAVPSSTISLFLDERFFNK